MLNFLYENIAILFNLAGTLCLAFSFGSYPSKKDAPYTADGSSKKYIAYFNYPKLFYLGLVLFFVGFLAQLKF